MTRTPDEIKKGLECFAASYADCHKECPYKLDCDGSQILKDALALIQKLEAERDALTEELRNSHSCFACKKFRRNGGECCGGSVCMMRDFEWRGVQKEE